MPFLRFLRFELACDQPVAPGNEVWVPPGQLGWCDTVLSDGLLVRLPEGGTVKVATAHVVHRHVNQERVLLPHALGLG